jgi:hypothetical protein
VICPKCSEVNSADFRFCGMCGTPLDLAPASRRPSDSHSSQVTTTPLPNRPLVAPQSQPLSRPSASEISPNPTSANQVSMDSLRERAFSGLDSFSEAERTSTSPRRIVLLVMLLAALGVAGWWTYKNYLGVAQTGKPDGESVGHSEPASSSPSNLPSPRQMAKDAAPESDAGSTPAAVPPPAVVEHRTPETAAKSDKDLTPTAPARTVLAKKTAAKRETEAPAPKPAKVVAPPAADTGDAEFKKAEAFLYGRGGAENCDEATKYLKAASAKSNARARSTFGTMYATGHCVARDLPTSYLWFALALRVDPNNQILEKDLSAVWNQMTPPERQMATRMKQ